METYIVFLRGINVGGHKKIPMKNLRILLENLKFDKVKTYIQSGNIVFNTSVKDKAKLEHQIKEAILNHFGFEVPVLIKTSSEIESILNKCPFSDEDKTKSYFVLLYSKPLEENKSILQSINYPNEIFKLINDCVYFFCSIGYGKAKCNNNFFEKKLKVTATARNYRTITKVLELATT